VDRAWTRIVVWVAVGEILAVDALYLLIIGSQGGPPTPDVLTVPFVATYLGLMAVLLAISLFTGKSAKPLLRAAPSGGLLVLAVIAAFSIGILILPAAGLAFASTVGALNVTRSPRVIAGSVSAAVVAVAVLVVGFQIAWHHLECPPTGSMGGTTAGFFGQLSYECDNGRLTTH
jgi:hypothetical protein